MNALKFLKTYLHEDRNGEPMFYLAKLTVPLVMPDIELNDDQCTSINSNIAYISAGIANTSEIHSQALELATYINSCYRPK